MRSSNISVCLSSNVSYEDGVGRRLAPKTVLTADANVQSMLTAMIAIIAVLGPAGS